MEGCPKAQRLEGKREGFPAVEPQGVDRQATTPGHVAGDDARNLWRTRPVSRTDSSGSRKPVVPVLIQASSDNSGSDEDHQFLPPLRIELAPEESA